MKLSAIVSASLFATLVACGGAKHEAKAPEADPWAGYQGNLADKAPARSGEAKPAVAAKEKQAEPKATEAKAKAPEEPAALPVPAKKSSKAMIKGESVSSIGADALATATGASLKAKVVSSDVTVGPQYELVSVQLKGASVQIVRPAATPDPKGPPISAPKERNGELSKTESGFYDADADVLVVVNAAKKASSKSSLGTILKK